jgi:hypothetical protein
MRDVESELAAVKSEHDPLASHIFVSRRHYRNVNDTKSGKRRETIARRASILPANLALGVASTSGSASWEPLRDSERAILAVRRTLWKRFPDDSRKGESLAVVVLVGIAFMEVLATLADR